MGVSVGLVHRSKNGIRVLGDRVRRRSFGSKRMIKWPRTEADYSPPVSVEVNLLVLELFF
jgi:hypothetical protein